METTCPKCGAIWEPDVQPDVELVLVDATGEAILAVGPEHRCRQ